MKNVSCYLILLLVPLTSCLSQRDFTAEYDYSYRGNFKRYQTFGFVEETGRDISSFQPVIEKTIGPITKKYAAPTNGGQKRFAAVDALIKRWVAGGGNNIPLVRA